MAQSPNTGNLCLVRLVARDGETKVELYLSEEAESALKRISDFSMKWKTGKGPVLRVTRIHERTMR